jgi:hypothetical protein
MAQQTNKAVAEVNAMSAAWRARLGATFQWLRRWAIHLILFAAMPAFTVPAFAQVSKEYQLKAVFLWRLAQFTEWPSDAFEKADSPIVICVLGENPFGDALDTAVRGETAHGRTLLVQTHRGIAQIRACHILYITGSGPRVGKEIATALAGRSVLTVNDAEGLPSAYQTIVVFITDQNKIRLRISLKGAAAARLVLDPRLLRAAEVVDE